MDARDTGQARKEIQGADNPVEGISDIYLVCNTKL
jgi:hypothetical protein